MFERLRIAAIGSLVVVAAACTPGPPSPSPIGSAGPASTEGTRPSSKASVPIADLRFTCGRFAFRADIVTAPAAQDQDALTPEAAFVREELRNAPPESGLPARGWRLVGSDPGHAEFVATGSDGGLVMVAVMKVNGAWTLDQEGACYAAVVVAEGIGPATWAWGSPGAPGPATRTFDALVTERACASGRPPVGRVVGPVVASTADVVLVFFGVHPLPGGGDCQSNPSLRVPVDLGEPLGDRKLLDGGHLAFGDPMHPSP